MAGWQHVVQGCHSRLVNMLLNGRMTTCCWNKDEQFATCFLLFSWEFREGNISWQCLLCFANAYIRRYHSMSLKFMNNQRMSWCRFKLSYGKYYTVSIFMFICWKYKQSGTLKCDIFPRLWTELWIFISCFIISIISSPCLCFLADKWYFKSDYEDWTRFQVCAIWSSPRQRRGLDQNARTWNLVQSELEDLKWHLMRINHYLISLDPVQGLN
jgi:hypothetical protein